MARKPTIRLGANSDAKQVARIDARTAEGRFVRLIEADLIAHIGGDPTTPQRLLIQSIVYKALRLAQITDAVRMKVKASEESLDKRFLAFSGSMREDLRLLGIERPKQEAPSLAQYLEGRAERAA